MIKFKEMKDYCREHRLDKDPPSPHNALCRDCEFYKTCPLLNEKENIRNESGSY